MNKLTVAVIFGGLSEEHEVSKASAATIISNMSEDKYTIIPVYITKEGEWLLYDGHLDNIKNLNWEKYGTNALLSPDRTHKGLLRIVSEKVKTIPIDVIFPVLHGKNGEDGTIQGLFELSGLPYVGSNVIASAVSMDKVFTKIIANSLRIDQADYLVYHAGDLENMDEMTKKIRYKLGYPCFVKPANSGSSVGISKAKNKKELEEAIKTAFEYDGKIVVEKAVKGRELECAVLGNTDSIVETSCVGEIISAAEYYDYDAKYNNSASKTIVPADLDEGVSNEIKEIAARIFKGVNGKGLARVDFFLEETTGRVIFNEINTLPGFTSISMYPMLWEERGLMIDELIDKLIELAL